MRSILLGLLLGLLGSHYHQSHQTQPEPSKAACHRAEHDSGGHLEEPQWSLTPVDKPDWFDQVCAEISLCFAGTTVRDVRVGAFGIEGGAYLGITFEEAGVLYIALDPRRITGGFEQAWEVLVHEWAHAALWDVWTTDSHGPLWGVKYAELYRLSIDPGPQPEEEEQED